MLPIFNDYICFLKHKTSELNFLQEGYYWYDKSIIKAFDITGNIVKIARLKIDDELNMTVKHYNEKYVSLENWEQTANRYKEELYQLEKDARKLITDSIHKYGDRKIAILSSGGEG